MSLTYLILDGERPAHDSNVLELVWLLSGMPVSSSYLLLNIIQHIFTMPKPCTFIQIVYKDS